MFGSMKIEAGEMSHGLEIIPELSEFENFQKTTHLIFNKLRSFFSQTIFRWV
jgi:hypothetical protein